MLTISIVRRYTPIVASENSREDERRHWTGLECLTCQIKEVMFKDMINVVYRIASASNPVLDIMLLHDPNMSSLCMSELHSTSTVQHISGTGTNTIVKFFKCCKKSTNTIFVCDIWSSVREFKIPWNTLSDNWVKSDWLKWSLLNLVLSINKSWCK